MSQSSVVKTVGGVTTKITTSTRTVTSSTQQQKQQQFQQQQQQTKQNVNSKPPSKTESGKENQISAESRTEDACVRCNRTVYKMEEVIAEHQVWHKDCFRCNECDKPLNRHSKVDRFQIHEGVVYCLFHFRQLFGPEDAPKKKPEFIIRENQPVELPEGVVRSSDQNDLGLETIQTAAVKNRFQMFEKIATTKETKEELQHNVGIKRSATVLSKMKKFHAKGMDVGLISNDSNSKKNGKESNEVYDDDDDNSINSEDYDDEADVDLIRAKRVLRERPVSFSEMKDIKSKFETGMEQGREARHKERKQEIQNIRATLFAGKQATTKVMYQNALADLESTSKLRNKSSTIAHDMVNVKAAAENAQNIKYKFESGDVYRKPSQDEDEDEDVKRQGKKDSKPGQISNKVSERMQILAKQQAQDELIKSHAKVKILEKADISNQYEFFENYDPEEHKKVGFKTATPRETPPRDNVKQQVSAYYDGNETDQNGIKIDGIKIDHLKMDGVVEKARSNYIDRINKTDTKKRQQVNNNVVDMSSANAKQQQAAPKILKNKKVDPAQNQPTPHVEPKSIKFSEEDNRRFYDESESEAENEISSRKPGYLDSDLEQARLASRTRDLKELFEKWNYENNVYDTAEYNDSIPEYDEIDDSQIETTKTIRAKFEKLPQSGKMQNSRQPKVNRFVNA